MTIFLIFWNIGYHLKQTLKFGLFLQLTRKKTKVFFLFYFIFSPSFHCTRAQGTTQNQIETVDQAWRRAYLPPSQLRLRRDSHASPPSSPCPELRRLSDFHAGSALRAPVKISPLLACTRAKDLNHVAATPILLQVSLFLSLFYNVF